MKWSKSLFWEYYNLNLIDKTWRSTCNFQPLKKTICFSPKFLTFLKSSWIIIMNNSNTIYVTSQRPRSAFVVIFLVVWIFEKIILNIFLAIFIFLDYFSWLLKTMFHADVFKALKINDRMLKKEIGLNETRIYISYHRKLLCSVTSIYSAPPPRAGCDVKI